MDSYGNLEHRTEALYLEVRPVEKAKLGVRVIHRKALSLDCDLLLPEHSIIPEHMLRSCYRSSISPHHRTIPLTQTPHMLLRRAGIEPVESDVSRGSQISLEDQEASSFFNHRAPLMLLSSSEDEHEVGEQTGATAQLSVASSLLTPTPTRERRQSKRERRRLKSLRRRQRRRERSRQSQLQENVQSSTGNPSSSSEDEEIQGRDREGYICAVCLDVYFSPYKCHPCSHIFCEPCLRTLAKNCPTNTPCPLCRTTITHVLFQKELNRTARTFFPKEYLSRKQTFQKAAFAKWPLPSCRKLFQIFGGSQRQAGPTGRRQVPHGGYRLDAFNFEDDSHSWRFDMDMVIIYIYSVNWVIGFIIFFLFCYFFFLSF